MEIFIVAATIFLAVFLTSLTYLAGVFAKTANAVYLGTVHWPGDYFYYLSQFAQGRYSWFLSYDLYSRDFPYKTPVGWVNVFLGRLFYLVGLDQLRAYQLSIIIFAAFFLGISYLLLRQIFPVRDRENSLKRTAAFMLFVFSNAFPQLIHKSGKTLIFYFDYWFNNGLPFNRLVSVPHQLVARSTIVLALFLSIVWWKDKRRGKKLLKLIMLSASGFILASVEPVQLTIVSLVILSVPLYFSIFKHEKIKFPDFAPVMFFGGGGLPMALYLKKLFSGPPYSQLVAWELAQSLKLSLFNFILANGPVMVLALFGIIIFAKKISRAKITALIFSFLTIGFFLSPIPAMAGLVNVRFLPPVTTLFLACFAIEVIFHLSQKISRKANAVTAGIVVLVLIMNIIHMAEQLKIRTKTDTANGFFYLDKKVIEAFDIAEQNSAYGDLFLVVWPFNASFPALATRHTYAGHPLLTIDSAVKDKKSSDFFYNVMNREEMKEFLRLNNIKYVLAYPWMERINSLPLLDKQFDNGMLAIYRVKKK